MVGQHCKKTTQFDEPGGEKCTTQYWLVIMMNFALFKTFLLHIKSMLNLIHILINIET